MSKRQRDAISKAVADPRRFDILMHIAAESCAACTGLRDEFPITAATLSHHLSELEAAGLITLSRRGKYVDATFCREVWNSYIQELEKL